MPQPVKIQIKPEWDGQEALAKAKRFTTELEKQAKWAEEIGDSFAQIGKIQTNKLRQGFAAIFGQIGAQEKKVKDWNKALGEVFAQIGGEKRKVWDSFFTRNETGMDRLIKRSKELREDLGTAFEVSTSRGVGFALTKITNGVDGALSKIFNLKNALAATLVGGAAYGLASSALRGGLGNVRDDAKLRREFRGQAYFGPARPADVLGAGQFGPTRPAQEMGYRDGMYDNVLSSIADISTSSGIEGGAATAALLPIARAIKETRVGSKLKGGKKLTNQDQVDAVRTQTLGLATSYTKRLLTLFPQEAPEEVGRLLAEAGTGEEGIGQLARFVGLGKASTKDILDDAKKKKLAIGDIVGKVLERGGVTDEAASDQRKTFDFQIKSIGSQLNDAIGNVGTSAIEKLNKSLGEGTTLAEKLQKYLGSPEGKKMIDKLGDSLSRVVSFAADLAKSIPGILSTIDRFKVPLLAIAGLYGAVKVGGVVANAVGSLGKAKEFLTGSRGSTPMNPLFVSQVGIGGGKGIPGAPGLGGIKGLLSKGGSLIGGIGAVAAAGGVGAGLLLAGAGAAAAGAGYLGGNYLGKHVGFVGKTHNSLANRLYNLTGEGAADKKLEDFDKAHFAAMLKRKNMEREVKVSNLMDTHHLNRGQALFAADHPNQPIPHVNVVVKVGEKELAAAVQSEVRKGQVNQSRNEAGK